ncbi:CAP domain-containing protein [Xylaria palmicola]|nr:CAP domain-containing protein [Xylaria palmicola]
MKSSIFAAAASAALAVANPLNKRVWETEVVVEYYTVTVTGDAPAATPTTTEKPHHTGPAQIVPPVKQPKPTTTPETVVYVTVTPEPEPEPTTTSVKSNPAPSTVENAPAQTSQTETMESAALYHHNIHRSNHSAPAVTWNSEIAGYAANTAATCHFAHDMNQGKGGYGQNIALWGVSSGASDLGAVGAVKMATTDMWYDGEFNNFLPSYYGQATPSMTEFESWGHLSQLVWAASNTVGCAVQFCPKGTAYDNLESWFTVCNYSPPGNVGGAYAKNIARPKGDAPVYTDPKKKNN